MKLTIGFIYLIFLTFAAQAQELKLEILNGHSGGGVLAVAVSSDGKFALTGSSDQTALLWDLETGKQLRRFVGHEDSVSAVAFSKDGKFVLTASYDKTARLWETATGKPVVLQENRNGIFAGHEGKILSAAISADGKLVATAGEDKTARIWDAVSGKQLHRLDHAGRVNSIAFSPDSQFLLTGGEDKIARLYSTANGKEIRQFVGHTREITSVAYSPDGKQVLTGSKDFTVRFWDRSAAKETRKIDVNPPYRVEIRTVLFTPSGRRFIVAGELSPIAIQMWDLESGIKVWEDKENTEFFGISSVVIIDENKILVADRKEDRKATLFDITESKIIQELQGKSEVVNITDISLDSRFALSGGNSETTALWNLTDGKIKQFWRELNPQNPNIKVDTKAASFSPNSNSYAVNEHTAFAILQIKDSKILQAFDYRRDGDENNYDLATVSSIDFSNNGNFILSSGGNKAFLWQIGTKDSTEKPKLNKKYLLEFEGHQDFINGVAFSPDDKTIATASSDKTVRLWNAETGEVKQIIEDFFAPVWSVVFSPDGKTIATASGGGVVSEVRNETEMKEARKANRVRFFDVETGEERLSESVSGWEKIFIKKVHGFKTVAYSPDGKFIAAGSFEGKVILRDNNTKIIRIFEGHTDTVNSVKFAKDANGKLLVVSGSSDSTTRIWDAATGEEICALVTFRDGNWAVVQTKTGRYDAPNGGEIDGIQWVFGNETIALNQLKDIYYTPNLLPRLLGYMPNQPLADVRPLKEIKLFPEIVEQNFDEKTANLTVKIKNRGGGIGAVRVMLNGNLASEDARSEDLKKQLKTNPNLTEAVVNFNVKTSAGFNPKGENCIDIITSDYDQKAQKSFVNSNPKCTSNPKISSRGTAVFNLGGNNNLPEPTLYAIVAGVSDYNGEQLDLNYAAKDAEDFANALGIGARNFLCKSGVPQCDKVQIKLLSTPPKGETKNPLELPTKSNIKAAFAEFAQKANPEDILVVYFSGHGVSLNVGEQETYFYLTQETDDGSPSAVRNRPERSISNTEVLDWLSQEFWRTDKKGIDAKNKVLILDTCAAGAFEKVLERNLSPDQIRALEKLKDRSGLQILMGSAANQSAYEASQYGQGLLTYALLEGMKGAALKNETSVETGTLFDYAVNRVPKMDISNGTSGLQSPRIFGSTSIPIGLILSKADKDAIKIQESPLPIFSRPSFIKKGKTYDTLRLGLAFEKKLDEAASPNSRGSNGNQNSAALVFISEGNFPGTYFVTGAYTEENGLITIEEIELIKDDKVIANLEKVSGKNEDEVTKLLLEAVLKKLAEVKNNSAKSG